MDFVIKFRCFCRFLERVSGRRGPAARDVMCEGWGGGRGEWGAAGVRRGLPLVPGDRTRTGVGPRPAQPGHCLARPWRSLGSCV